MSVNRKVTVPVGRLFVDTALTRCTQPAADRQRLLPEIGPAQRQVLYSPWPLCTDKRRGTVHGTDGTCLKTNVPAVAAGQEPAGHDDFVVSTQVVGGLEVDRGRQPGTWSGRARLAAHRSISSLASTVCDVIDQRGPRAPTRQRAERSIRRSSGGFDDAVRASIKRSGSAAEICRLGRRIWELLLTSADWLPRRFQEDEPEVGMDGASDNGLDEPDRRGAAFRSGYVTAECHGATALRPGRGG